MVCLIPNISHDYKLTLLVLPWVAIIGDHQETRSPERLPTLLLSFISILTGLLLLPPHHTIPKTPILFALELLYGVLAALQKKKTIVDLPNPRKN